MLLCVNSASGSVVQERVRDVIYWMRQALGLVCGITGGLLPLVGGIWLLL